MPIVKIEVCRSRPTEQITAMINAVYQAQLVAFKLPEDDKQIRYVEHRPECFPVPPGKTE
jgi:phenylpyruvate tautomerase PptA (4-oxalocrotonate tautomerase family)